MKLPPEESDCTCDYSQWFHASKNRGIPDEIISAAWNATPKSISFIFHQRSAAKQIDPKEEEEKQEKSKKKQEYRDDECEEDLIEIDDSGDEDYR